MRFNCYRGVSSGQRSGGRGQGLAAVERRPRWLHMVGYSVTYDSERKAPFGHICRVRINRLSSKHFISNDQASSGMYLARVALVCGCRSHVESSGDAVCDCRICCRLVYVVWKWSREVASELRDSRKHMIYVYGVCSGRRGMRRLWHELRSNPAVYEDTMMSFRGALTFFTILTGSRGPRYPQGGC